MKRHPKYKDSGVPWLGQVPAHWGARKLAHVCVETGVKNRGMIEDNLLSLSYGQIIRKDIESNEGLLPASFEGYQIVEEGDTVLRLTDLQNDQKSLRAGFTRERGIITSAYCAVRPTGISGRWLYNALRASDLLKVFYSMGGGVRQSLDFDSIKRIQIPVPPMPEQLSIDAYLIAEEERVGKAIASQQRMIELLKERRSAIITQAVTKGLDPKAKMKDSGVPWLGQVPAHWPLVRIGSQTALRSEKGSDKDFSPLSVTKLGVVPQLETAAKTDDGDNRKVVRKGDFVINGRSDRKGSSGVSAMDGSVSLINITIKLGAGFYPRFAHHLFRSYAFQEEFYRWGKGIVADLWSTNYWDFKRIMCAMPTLEEQETIANYLDEELFEMDSAISSQKRMIELLKERRAAIITQAVTGQVDVR